jgi:phosphoadenosine phosphosulfate reductase
MQPPVRREPGAPLATAQRVIAQAIESYPGRLTLACSFGGPSGMVLLDIALGLEPRLPVFCIDTELLFGETYALVRRVEERYGIHVDLVRPLQSVAEQAAVHGPALWARDPDACCALRKVEPLKRYLRGYDAWLTGLRRDQTDTRAHLQSVEWDDASQVVRVAPLATWTEDEVWGYVRDHGLEVNSLHFEGYPSIGCTHCTRPVSPTENARAGRWSGFDKTECGIHVFPSTEHVPNHDR